MAESYRVLGLDLRADFPLPGLVPEVGDDALPAVAVSIIAAGRLEASWSGGATPGRWRGLLGDGERFEIERGREGDLLFHYGARARFHLGADGRSLSCCPLDIDGPGWTRALLTKVLPGVAIANGHEALHAAAVADDRGAILILAPSGGGKSTLALELARRGFRFFADDVVVLGHRAGDRVEAHPGGPFVNLPPRGGLAAAPPHAVLDSGPLKSWVAIDGAATQPAPVRALVRLERTGGGMLGAWPIGASPVPLAPFMLGLPDDEGRDARRFAVYSDLVGSAPMIRLTGGAGNSPADLAEALLRSPALADVATSGVAS